MSNKLPNKRKHNTLFSYFTKNTNSVVTDSNPDDPLPASRLQKHTDTLVLVSKKYVFDYLSTKQLRLTKLLIKLTNNIY